MSPRATRRAASGSSSLSGRGAVFGGAFAPLLPGVEMTEKRMTWEVSDHLPLWAEMRVGS